MDSTNLSLELLPLDSPQAAAPAGKASAEIEIVPVGATPASPVAPTEKVDRYLTEATHQYVEGHLDQPLWDRAFAKAKGEKEAAVEIYLQARAVALRVLDRERRTAKRPDAAHVVLPELDKATGLEAFGDQGTLGFGRVFAKYRIAIIAGAILVLMAVGGWLLMSSWNAKPADASAVIRVAPASGSATARAPAAAAQGSTESAGAKAMQPAAGPELMQKIQDLRDAGNWNVLVFYLAEWTRKEPANPVAWDQLRAGYVMLRQYDDALGAAKKARDLAPGDPQMWRHLGAAQADVGDPEAALRAFDQAVAHDANDAETFKRIGMLNAQMSQVQEAGRAFDRALALSPGDATTLCMRSAVAQLSSAPKDSYATAKLVKSIDGKCRGTS
jgi:tetratricopeptide (TPR) repeat protein